MNNSINQKNTHIKKIDKDKTVVDDIKILSEFTKKYIEKSFNIDSAKGMEAYFSNRYGWTLRRTKD